MSSLNQLSYNISCEHIKKLNEKYNDLNDKLFKEKMICHNNYDDDNNINKKNIKYLNNIYVSRKSCIYKSTEPDELLWTSSFTNLDKPSWKSYELEPEKKYRNIDIYFNENTRRKILTRY